MRGLHGAEVLRQLGHPQQMVSVERFTRTDGPAAGAAVLLVRNPWGISMEVLLDRALDIGWADATGFPLAWKSPRGHVSSARQEPDGNGWAETFPGGLLATCGLRSTGMASTVDGVHYGLHGRVGGIPAEHVRYGVATDEDGQALVEISGEVVEGSLGSTPLVLTRRLTLRTDRPELRVEDTVTNAGYEVAGHMFRHHFNLGFPAVQAGSQVASSALAYATRDPGSLPGLPWTLPHESELGSDELAEKVVYCRPSGATVRTRITAPDGSWVEVENPAEQWPFLILWRDPRPGINVLGVEPSTSEDGGRAHAEESGTVVWLEPGEGVSYSSTVRAGCPRSPGPAS